MQMEQNQDESCIHETLITGKWQLTRSNGASIDQGGKRPHCIFGDFFYFLVTFKIKFTKKHKIILIVKIRRDQIYLLPTKPCSTRL